MNNIIGRECRFAIHIPSKDKDTPDYHLVKEQVHYEDGTIEPKIRYIKNFKRPFYYTKPNKQNHKDKKEWESLDNVLIKEVRQSDLRNEVAKALNMRWSNAPMKELLSSPFIYGAELSSSSLIKKMYEDKYPNLKSAYTVAAFDIETDVNDKNNDIIMASLVFKDKACVVVNKNFISGFNDPKTAFFNCCDKYIKEYIDKHNLKIDFYIGKDTLDILKHIFDKAHEWKPDFLAIWNMNFDIPKVLEMIEFHNGDPKEILCDRTLPYKYRICNYRLGKQKKVTASGKVMPINPAAQWHTLQLTASFYVIDAMCVYRQTRIAQQEKSSYALDAILNLELGIRKLKFKEADAYTGLNWHSFMQLNYKIEYIVYNLFDSLSMLELEYKNKDLSVVLPTFAGITDFWNFNRQPKKISDAFHFFLLKNGHVPGTIGMEIKNRKKVYSHEDEPEEEEEEEPETLGLDDWIVALSSHMSVPGIKCIAEDKELESDIRCYVFDSDAVSAYPRCISVANVSKSTTKRELINIEGIDERLFRMQNLNLILGHTNAYEYTCKMFNMPEAYQLLEEFKKDNI